ncbi:unnamed protein product [Protopolystoma xenopodis]|uniref:Muscleblind-like CCCH zinc finger domain-containing protein n=1 Tax=Protopolystoma xenopodis TaxID=117903 RepID=A0A448XIU0_9PLAT|nr:unnamed protein product [Protopolystoma xenopodis]
MTTGSVRVRRRSKRRQDWCKWPLCQPFRTSGVCPFGGPPAHNHASASSLSPVSQLAYSGAVGSEGANYETNNDALIPIAVTLQEGDAPSDLASRRVQFAQTTSERLQLPSLRQLQTTLNPIFFGRQACWNAHIEPNRKAYLTSDGQVRVCFDSMGLLQPRCRRNECAFFHPPKHIRDLIVARRHAQYLREKLSPTADSNEGSNKPMAPIADLGAHVCQPSHPLALSPPPISPLQTTSLPLPLTLPLPFPLPLQLPLSLPLPMPMPLPMPLSLTLPRPLTTIPLPPSILASLCQANMDTIAWQRQPDDSVTMATATNTVGLSPCLLSARIMPDGEAASARLSCLPVNSASAKPGLERLGHSSCSQFTNAQSVRQVGLHTSATTADVGGDTTHFSAMLPMTPQARSQPGLAESSFLASLPRLLLPSAEAVTSPAQSRRLGLYSAYPHPQLAAEPTADFASAVASSLTASNCLFSHEGSGLNAKTYSQLTRRTVASETSGGAGGTGIPMHQDLGCSELPVPMAILDQLSACLGLVISPPHVLPTSALGHQIAGLLTTNQSRHLYGASTSEHLQTQPDKAASAERQVCLLTDMGIQVKVD